MKLVDIIFCDDIRREINNKVSLMGLYGDQIIMHLPASAGEAINWPVPMKLAAWMRFRLEGQDKCPEKYIVEYFLNEKNVLKFEGEINKIEKGQSQFNLMLIADKLPLVPGALGVSIQLLKRKEILFSEKNMDMLKIFVTPTQL